MNTPRVKRQIGSHYVQGDASEWVWEPILERHNVFQWDGVAAAEARCVHNLSVTDGMTCRLNFSSRNMISTEFLIQYIRNTTIQNLCQKHFI